MDTFVFAVTVAAQLFGVVVGWRRKTPLVPTTLAALGLPVLTYQVYAQPLDGVLFVLLVAAGIAGGTFAYSKSAAWPLEWLHPTRSSRLIRVAWSGLFLGVQAAELWGSETQFQLLMGLYAVVGGGWAALLIGFRLKPRVTILADGAAGQAHSESARVGWVPSHAVGAAGASTFASPHPDAAQLPALAPDLPVQVLVERGQWANVSCSNGFTAWVDSRLLVPSASAAARGPLAPG